MSTLELKEHLKSRIDEISDESILNQITEILGIKNETIIILSDEQKISIKKSQIEYLQGNFIENDVLNQEMEKWLKE